MTSIEYNETGEKRSVYTFDNTTGRECTITGNENRYQKITREGSVRTELEYDNETGSTETIYDGTTTTVIERNSDDIETKRTIKEGSSAQIITTDTESGKVSTLNISNGRNMSQIVEIDGQTYKVHYDGMGHTKGVIVQYNEPTDAIAQRFNCDKAELLRVNIGQVQGKAPNQYFLAGAKILLPTEMDAEEFNKLNSGRMSSTEASEALSTAYLEQAKTEVAGKPVKQITSEKDYPNWETFAKEYLISQGNKNPTASQINTTRNQLCVLNSNIQIPSKGDSINVLKTERDVEIISQPKTYTRDIPFMKDNDFSLASDNTRITDAKLEQLKIEENKKQKIETRINNYKNPTKTDVETRKKMVAELKNELASAKLSFQERLKADGWTADFADFFSKIWNNDTFMLGLLNTGNTADQIREKLNDLEEFINNLEKADNSEEGCLKGADFDSIYESFTGVDFDAKAINEYYKVKEDYEKTATLIATRDAINARIDAAFSNYDKIMKENAKSRRMGAHQALYSDHTEIRKQGEAEEEIFKVFHDLTGITREEWNRCAFESVQKGVSFIKTMREYAACIKRKINENIKLSDDDLMKKYDKMNSARSNAFGNSDIIKSVEKYNSSQEIGGAVVAGAAQMVIWSAAMLVTGGGALVSGLAYAGGYLTVEVSDRLTNGIDDSEDLWNAEVMQQLAKNTSLEFATGFLFETAFVKGKFDKLATYIVDNVGKKAVTQTGVRMSQQQVESMKAKYMRSMMVKGVSSGSKDGVKEISKETLKSKISISDISAKAIWGFAVGAVMGAFKLRLGSKNPVYNVTDKLSKTPKKIGSKETQHLLHDEDNNPNIKFEENLLEDIQKEMIKTAEAENKEIAQIMKDNPQDTITIIVEVLNTMTPEQY